MEKAFWSHFKHFGRLLGKIYLFLTPSKTDGCGHRAKFSPSHPLVHPELSICQQHSP